LTPSQARQRTAHVVLRRVTLDGFARVIEVSPRKLWCRFVAED
jgi:hypothetical protein